MKLYRHEHTQLQASRACSILGTRFRHGDYINIALRYNWDTDEGIGAGGPWGFGGYTAHHIKSVSYKIIDLQTGIIIMNGDSRPLLNRDHIATEMARRKLAFHNDEQWDTISLWGLFSYNKNLQRYFDEGKLLNHLNYKPENETYWVKPTAAYWEDTIKPIVQDYTLDELNYHFTYGV